MFTHQQRGITEGASSEYISQLSPVSPICQSHCLLINEEKSAFFVVCLIQSLVVYTYVFKFNDLITTSLQDFKRLTLKLGQAFFFSYSKTLLSHQHWDNSETGGLANLAA